MEIKFENKYVLTKQILKSNYFSSMSSPAAILLYVSFFLLLTNILIKDRSPGMLLVVFLLSSLFAVSIFYGYRFTVSIAIKRNEELNGGKPLDVQLSATDECITSTSQITTYTLDYTKIKRAYQTKKLIVLIFASNSAVLLPKDSFTIGTPDEFIEFLKQKNIKLRRTSLLLSVATALLAAWTLFLLITTIFF